MTTTTTQKKNKSLVKKPITESTVLERALRILAVRAHSKKELCLKLKKAFQSVPVSWLDRVLSRLEELGYINEEELSEKIVKHIVLEKQRGMPFVMNKLRTLEIPEKYWAKAQALAEDFLCEAVGKFVDKQLRTLPDGMSLFQKNKKIMERGLRRGFSASDIMKLLTSVPFETA